MRRQLKAKIFRTFIMLKTPLDVTNNHKDQSVRATPPPKHTTVHTGAKQRGMSLFLLPGRILQQFVRSGEDEGWYFAVTTDNIHVNVSKESCKASKQAASQEIRCCLSSLCSLLFHVAQNTGYGAYFDALYIVCLKEIVHPYHGIFNWDSSLIELIFV